MQEKLSQIRTKSNTNITLHQKILQVLIFFLLGAVLGFSAKYFDNIPIAGEIGTSLGIWILIATIIAVWSRSPISAALHVLIFFLAMLIAYYTYSKVLFGFFPCYYFIAWGSIALISPLCAYIVWYAHGNGWIAAFCASLPISLLLAEGYSFFYTLSIPGGFDVAAAVFLFIILPNQANQRLRILLFTGIAAYLFSKLNLISLLFGGL